MLALGQVILRLILAAVLGSIVGYERERQDKAAGLRTHMLVCVGAALTMIVSTYGFCDVLGKQPATSLDPSRIAAQVVSGIGFLGAGIIIFRRDVVIGLTTAAGIWAIAAVGLAVGGGLYLPAIAATILIISVMAAFRPLERRLHSDRNPTLTVILEHGIPPAILEDTLSKFNTDIRGVKTEPTESGDKLRVTIVLTSLPTRKLMTFVNQIGRISGVSSVEVS